MKNLSLLIFILISNLSVAQIDTTNWYPLQTGNTWQFSYYNFFGEYFDITIEVIGDTVINEKEYYIVNSGRNDYYQRVENNEFVYEYSPYSNQEYVRYDFVSPDKSIWDLDSIGGQYGVYESRERYIKIYGDSLKSKIYNSAYISYRSTDPDTSWGPFVDGSAVALSKGLGITEYQQGASSGNYKHFY